MCHFAIIVLTEKEGRTEKFHGGYAMQYWFGLRGLPLKAREKGLERPILPFTINTSISRHTGSPKSLARKRIITLFHLL